MQTRTQAASLFDGADPNVSTARRELTTVPTQALYLMNNEFVHNRAASLTDLLIAAEPQSVERIRLAFVRTIGRPPRNDEPTDSLSFVDDYRRVMGDTGMSEREIERAAWSGS